MNETAQDSRTCSECGSLIPAGTRTDHCPLCLLKLAGTVFAADAHHESPERASKARAAGAVVGNYELLERLGEGGMGVVYKARQLKLNRIVALKMVRSGALASEAEVRRFDREAQAAACLAHPNIVAIHEVGEDGGQPFFSMDYVQGPNLAQEIRHAPLPAERAARYVRAIAEAIQYAHDRGILHRDLKPANVLIDADDKPRVMDFGLAKRTEREPHEAETGSGSNLTLTGAVLGTPGYMPPEQARGCRQAIGPASDVYSLGAILYDCLTGRPPFRADTPVDTLRQVVDAEPAAPRLLNRNVPRDLETICLKCLAKEAGQRYLSARALADDLGRFLRHEPITARPLGWTARLWRWSQRNSSVAVLGASLVLVLLLLAVAALTFRSDAAKFVTQVVDLAANSVSLALTKRGAIVQDLASSLELHALLARRDQRGLTNWLAGAYARTQQAAAGSLFENLLVLNAEGQAIARYPQGTNQAPVARGDRDYFTGATAGSTHYSRIFESVDDQKHKLAVSSLIRDATGKQLGVIAAMVGTGLPETLSSLIDGNSKLALAGQTDVSILAGQKASSPTFLIVWHAAFRHRSGERAIEIGPRYEGLFSRLMLMTNNAPAVHFESRYRDPAADRYREFFGRWLAAFKRVPDTPYIVICQTRDRVFDAFATAGGLGVVIALAMLVRRWVKRYRQGEKSV